MILLLLACADQGGPTPVLDTSDWTDPLDPDAEHILVSSLVFLDGHALSELRPDLSLSWSAELPPESGAQGADRLPDGTTVLANVLAPPVYVSTFDLMDADGGILWSYDDLSAVGFSHGVRATAAGDFVGLDTAGGELISFDPAGTLLWSQEVSDEGETFRPNGVDVYTEDDGSTLIAVSELERSGNGQPDQLALYRMVARDAAPERLWRVPVQNLRGGGAWPHGPRVQGDGTVTVCHSSSGQVVAYDAEDGAELWRLPETGAPPSFAFPRDALFLSDGSLVVADAAAEVVRVSDPFGAFEVVAAAPTPGVFGITRVVCGEGGGLPCLEGAGE